MRRRASDLPFVIEVSNGDAWSPIARFKTEHYARLFMEGARQYSGAKLDRVHHRLKNVNKILD
jgi:hypothetical protein